MLTYVLDFLDCLLTYLTYLDGLREVDVAAEPVALLLGRVGLRVDAHIDHDRAGLEPVGADLVGLGLAGLGVGFGVGFGFGVGLAGYGFGFGFGVGLAGLRLGRAVTISALPTAAMTMSARRTCARMSAVREWHTVTWLR